jgi:hypothetical protein
MKSLARLIGIIAICILGLFALLHIVPLPLGASMLVENPTPLKLKGIDRNRPVIAQLTWDNPKIKLRGFQVNAQISGTFTDSNLVLAQLINPIGTQVILDKSKLKVSLRDNSKLSCAGTGTGLECLGQLRMTIDTFLGKIKNTLTLATASNSALLGNEIILSHRITDAKGVPSLVIDALNKELAKKDRSKSLPNFFVDHNVTITDHAFVGHSDNNTLGLQMTLKMSLGELVKSVF